MLVLGIESSCDDLSMALVQDGRVLANVTASQTAAHAPFGGVVPEIASRRHFESLESTLEHALEKAGKKLSDLQGIAATYAPGLVGSLLVGLNFAKGLAMATGLPFRGVHHIEGHLWSAAIENEIQGPFLGLAVSGGHTHLYLVKEIGDYRILGHTVDDAAGEAFDKVAKLIGLGYPGGPAIDRLSEQGDSQAFSFALPRVKGHPLHTSFSGMKTAAVDYFNSSGSAPQFQANMSASFQASVVRALATMMDRASQLHAVPQWVLAGGVACNRALRAALEKLSQEKGVRLAMPSPKFCTDNGAMIAWTGERYLQRGAVSPLTLNALARSPLGAA